ncbi:hypothetical protein SBA3_1970005 [Candidatus Sulfopaludibacter sp. SbA3]|nr:hypothetical protein SBA3_1970005 [Candidatus Sulfopaludibacter sp. SbA3]
MAKRPLRADAALRVLPDAAAKAWIKTPIDAFISDIPAMRASKVPP